MPRRVATGVDPKRLAMIVAVLSRHAGVALGAADVFVNVAGGVRIDEPGADLAIALAIASAARGVPVREGTAAFGEIGLTGRLRLATQSERRLDECAKLGIRSVVAPSETPRAWQTPVAGRADAARRRPLRWPWRSASQTGGDGSEPTTDRDGDRGADATEHPGWEGRLREAISRVAPGTPLRQGIDDIIRSHQGALIVIGHPDELSFLYSGGIRIDQPFTPQLVYELAKMDGAIVVDEKPDADRVRERPADARPHDPVGGDGDAPSHGRAGRQADGRPRRLHLAAARDRDDLHRAGPLPARPDVLGLRQGEPGRSRRSRPTAAGSTRC